MDSPPSPPPPSPPLTTTIPTTHESGIDPPTWVPVNRMETHHTPPLNKCVLNLHQFPTPLYVGYGKCRKNHAIDSGGLTLDGCGEFVPTPISTPTDLDTQKCIACGCHRSFHRCDVAQFHQSVQHIIDYQHHHHQSSTSPPSHLATMENNSSSPDSSSPSPISSSYYPVLPHMFLNVNQDVPPPQPTNNCTPIFTTNTVVVSRSSQNEKKRFRSKFSQFQKEKMQEFAERIGWKMQRTKEDIIVGFCDEIGVTKDVFKVWMHNHKNISSNSNRKNKLGDGGNATTTKRSSSSF